MIGKIACWDIELNRDMKAGRTSHLPMYGILRSILFCAFTLAEARSAFVFEETVTRV